MATITDNQQDWSDDPEILRKIDLIEQLERWQFLVPIVTVIVAALAGILSFLLVGLIGQFLPTHWDVYIAFVQASFLVGWAIGTLYGLVALYGRFKERLYQDVLEAQYPDEVKRLREIQEEIKQITQESRKG